MTRFDLQNAPIYSDDPAEEEMMIELNGAWDYAREANASVALDGEYEAYCDDMMHRADEGLEDLSFEAWKADRVKRFATPDGWGEVSPEDLPF